jgi:rhamnogalacturonan endolyase
MKIRGSLALGMFWALALGAGRQMEYLSRGVVAVNDGKGGVFISWRLMATDEEDVTFDVYRDGSKINGKPIAKGTWFLDTNAKDGGKTYVVKPSSGEEGEYVIKNDAPKEPYIQIPLKTPPNHVPNDATVADLDGDGDYEIVVKMEQTPRDNSRDGPTGETMLQAYKLDGTLLWTINWGKNIREGAHYTQFMVYDLDGDGIAEVVLKTADGTTDGKAHVIGDAKADWRNSAGRILTGGEFLTVLSGKTGQELATVDYVPTRGNVSDWGTPQRTDNNGNRADRMLACVAYLDGEHPSVVMCRGYYARSVLVAWDWRDGKLRQRWVFDTAKDGVGKDGKPNAAYAGQGNHNLTAADVDGDGKDEIVYGSMVVDDNGAGLCSTGLGHGDSLYVSDLDPDRPGLEAWGIHEIASGAKGIGTAMYDPGNGKILFSGDVDHDVGRGCAGDIDPRHPGCEVWGGSEGLKTCKGEKIGKAPAATNFMVWWDGDLLRELLDGTTIYKWDYLNQKQTPMMIAQGCASNNGTKATPALCADVFGDWREEVIWRTADNKYLRIYATTIPTDYRMTTLMRDPQYRLGVVWQNVAYNQPPHTSFFLGEGMKPAPKPKMDILKRK